MCPYDTDGPHISRLVPRNGEGLNQCMFNTDIVLIETDMNYVWKQISALMLNELPFWKSMKNSFKWYSRKWAIKRPITLAKLITSKIPVSKIIISLLIYESVKTRQCEKQSYNSICLLLSGFIKRILHVPIFSLELCQVCQRFHQHLHGNQDQLAPASLSVLLNAWKITKCNVCRHQLWDYNSSVLTKN